VPAAYREQIRAAGPQARGDHHERADTAAPAALRHVDDRSRRDCHHGQVYLLGVGLVVVFFGISAVAMSWAARKSPQVTMVTAVSTYLVKIIALLFLVARYSGTTAFNGKLFGLTVVVCVVVWTTAQALVAARLKVPYVEPDGKR